MTARRANAGSPGDGQQAEPVVHSENSVRSFRPTLENFDFYVANPLGLCDAGPAIAAARAGGVGLLDLSFCRDGELVRREAARLRSATDGRVGLILDASDEHLAHDALAAIGSCDLVVVAPYPYGANLGPEAADRLCPCLDQAREVASRVGMVVSCEQQAHWAAEHGIDLLLAKGHESGGCVGDETSLILLQRLLARQQLPIVVWGGIGRRTVAAAFVAGAHGVVLDWQLALTSESPIPAPFRRRLAQIDGSETVALESPAGGQFRLFSQPGYTAAATLEGVADRLLAAPSSQADVAGAAHEWQQAIAVGLSQRSERERIWAIGQDAALAVSWSREVQSIGQALRMLRRDLRKSVTAARRQSAVRPGNPLAESHGTEFPVVQGPMTRVSDVPEFAQAVAEAGGLPFLALALMSPEQVRKLLEATRDLLGPLPWGVGVLGFVDRDLRARQFAVIEEVRPPFAVIAGGRPDQAASLEARGITTYLHVPSPGMLSMFLSEGARRFVFEGRECGGHVGPRSSFVLWESMIQVLLDAPLSPQQAADVHVLFAGGIHDGLSAAMVSVLAESLIERGMKVGVLLGTAYLFTHEIVASGAIVEGFQQAAIQTDQTVLLETGPGHATRCARTEFYDAFLTEKRRLKQEAVPAERIREELEQMNLGRLRIASKGVARKTSPPPGESPYAHLPPDEQRREGMYMIGQLAALRDHRSTCRELHEDVCLGAQRLLAAGEREEPHQVAPTADAPPTLDIAIVGMSCLFPGAEDLVSYWRNVIERRDVVREIPRDRFEWERWFDADRSAEDKIYSRWGGFLDDVEFDPLRYGVPPAALRQIEPMQLLTLVLVDRALRDASYDRENPHKERTSVIFGAGGGIAELGTGYAVRAMMPQIAENSSPAVLDALPTWSEDSFAGILMNVVAGRVANRFDFGGVNFTVDAACASSLAAIYLACRELVERTSDMVVCGGCDTLQSPFTYLCFGTAGALSPTGRSRTFDSQSDGIAISEGLAAVVLKRREDAERDGDRIYAVIRAVAGGSDGRSKGMTAPRMEGQLRTLERAYAQARFNPATVGLFEAHGTGTVVGDQTECRALGRLLTLAGSAARQAAVGSVKSMMGHTKCTAGVAGVIKSALALYYRALPPTMHVERPNPEAGLVDGPLYVNSQLRPWIRSEHPRRAGISSFGFGGTNFHAVLEEYAAAATPTPPVARRFREAELFLLADSTPAGLARRAQGFAKQVRAAVEAGAEVDLPNLAFTWHARQASASGVYRAAVVAPNAEQLAVQLDVLAAHLSVATGAGPPALPPGVFYSSTPLADSGKIAFLYPGQGSQFVEMLRDLALDFSDVNNAFARADGVLAGSYDRALSRYIFPPPTFDDDQRRLAAEELKATDVLQPALGVCDWALHRLLDSFGVRPEMVAGHSYGELVALCAAGTIDEEQLYRLSLARGRAIADLAREGEGRELGQMLAVRGSAEQVAQAIGDVAEVWLANLNSPRQTIVSGTAAGLAEAARRCDAARLATTPIPVACAFHSPLMDPARERFATDLAACDFAPPQLATFSNATATPYPGEAAAVRELLMQHLTGQVRFADEIEAMYAAGARIFVEAGPGRVLSRLVAEILGDRPHVAVATQLSNRAGYSEWLAALAEIYAQGVPVDAERLYAGRQVELIDLASLASQVQRAPAPHVWLVNGGYARPSSEPPRVLQPRARLVDLHATVTETTVPVMQKPTPESVSATQTPTPAPVPPPAPYMVAPANMPAHVVAGAVPATTAGPVVSSPASLSVPPEALADFQDTMRMFLRTQESVLSAMFGGGAMPAPAESQTYVSVAAVAPPAFAPLPPSGERAASVPVAAPPATPAPQPEPAPVIAAPLPVAPPAATPATPLPMAADLPQLLVDIASDRTGYPADMLPMEANLEADLGIDSIKRVEIIGAFRRAAVPQVEEPPAWFMERVSGAATLRDILAGVEQLAQETQGNTPATAVQEKLQESLVVVQGHDGASAHDESKSPEELTTLLVGVVSERTGYPADMLDLEANLEADLGIDSIKRVEIIGAFRRAAVPAVKDPPSWFMEQMSGATSLRTIVEGVVRLSSSGSATVAAKAAPATTPTRTAAPTAPAALHSNGNGTNGHSHAPRERSATCPRCVVTSVEVPFDADGGLALPPGLVLITDDGQGLAAQLAHEIAQRGGRAEILPGDTLASREAAESDVAELRRRHGQIGALLHLAPLAAAPEFPALERGDWNNFYRREVRGLLFLLQALAPELSSNDSAGFPVLAASLGAGDFNTPGDATRPWRGGLAGMLKTAAKEWPTASFRTVDYDAAPDVASLVRELLAAGPVEIGYRQGKRLTPRPLHRELTEEGTSPPTLTLDRSHVVLLAGGARGITAQMAREIAHATQATLILVGRSPMPAEHEDPATAGATDATALRQALLAQLRAAGGTVSPRDVEHRLRRLLADREIRETLNELRAQGSRAEYIECDVRDRAAFAKALADCRARHGRLDVVVHGAGVIEDRLIRDKATDSFDAVVSTKIDPLLTIVGELDAAHVGALVLFSSVAGFFGNAGQCDYAAANEILNRVARRLNDVWPGRVVALNWGPWAGAGMVTPEVARQFAARGVNMIAPAAGSHAAVRELLFGPRHDCAVIYGAGPWVDQDQATLDLTPAEVIEASTPLLAAGRVRRLEDGGIEAELTLDVAELPLLGDHVIDGRAVLPAALALELMAEAAQAAAPTGWQVTHVEDVRMFAGIVFQTPERKLVVEATPLSRDDRAGQWRVRIFDAAQRKRPHYQSTVRISLDRPMPPPAPQLARIGTRFPLDTVTEAYDRWLFHGPLFRAIAELPGLDISGVDAIFQPSSPRQCLGRESAPSWLIDPVVIDACPQLAMLWSRATFDTSPLPNRVAVYHRFGPLSGGRLEALFRLDPSTNESAYKADVWLLRDGQVVGLLQGLEGAGTAALNRIAGSVSR
ncbi:MAG: SDR family NAD(P)-dependent oxidoreductase [Pirellulales bacterium]|nr:SDR family NAD(P)-dependent oxidoreductase [Pirellulales bacterium]